MVFVPHLKKWRTKSWLWSDADLQEYDGIFFSYEDKKASSNEVSTRQNINFILKLIIFLVFLDFQFSRSDCSRFVSLTGLDFRFFCCLLHRNRFLFDETVWWKSLANICCDFRNEKFETFINVLFIIKHQYFD